MREQINLTLDDLCAILDWVEENLFDCDMRVEDENDKGVGKAYKRIRKEIKIHEQRRIPED